MNQETIRPFTSDGCSGGMSKLWRKVFDRAPPWEGCCVEHDRAYWEGGTRFQRWAADLALAVCVARRGYPVIGALMWVAVRAFGHPSWPTSYRWGYGYKYRMGYGQR